MLDPAGLEPSLRFAVQNYFIGGYHPMGYVGLGTAVDNARIDSTEFDDPYLDKTLSYEFDPGLVRVADKRPHEKPVVSLVLRQNYPNPFNPSTTIEYSLPENSMVSLTVFNSRGRQVAALLKDQKQPSGIHHVNFNAENLPSGLYFYRLATENNTAIGKMLFIK